MVKKLLIVGIILLVVIIIPLTIYLVSQQQNVSSNAQSTATVTPPPGNTVAQVVATETPTPTPTAACQPPGQVLNVKITYPLCQGQQCQFTQAGCSWDATPGAASYTVKITLVDTNTVISQQTLQAPTVTTSFNVTQGKTYRCDITAVNACGAAGATGTDSLLCQVDQIVTTTPTLTPTVITPTPSVVTVTPTPTAILTTVTPVPSLPPTGNESLMKIGAGGVLVTTFGGLLFLLSIL